jgi:hypothetical protein
MKVLHVLADGHIPQESGLAMTPGLNNLKQPACA